MNELGDWSGLILALAGYGCVVVALALLGRGRWGAHPGLITIRISTGLERVTRVPGWAAAMVGTASFGLLVAGMGFYRDVAWHVNLGRDEELFTAPHTAIVMGLLTILGSAFVGEWFATATRAGVGMWIGRTRIPYSVLMMGLLGASAVAGFPLDELWHRAYGIDVTMWSPTHLLMIVGASLSPLASWLALAEAGVRPSDGKWAGGLHIAVGSIALLGLSSVQGEFAFGVPQFQQLYHPVLYALAAGIALTAVAVVVRRWWALLIVAGVGIGIGTGDLVAERAASEARAASLYVVAALAVAVVAKVVGTERRSRFAVVSGTAIGTVGLAAEWLWSRGGHQPWGTALLPEGVVLPLLVAIGASFVGAAFGAAVHGEPTGIPARLLVVAGLALLVGLALPLPRGGLDASARIDVSTKDGAVGVRAQLSPPDAANDARWFQLIAWQGGGFVSTDMVPTGEPGTYESERRLPATGKWKTMLRLHRGASMVAIPIWLPADAEIDEPEVAVADKSAPFEKEQRYLLREQRAGPEWFAPVVYAGLGLLALAWIGGFVFVAAMVSRRRVVSIASQEMARV